MATDVSIKMGVEGESSFRAALQGINAQIKNLSSEMKLAVSSMSGLDSAESKAAQKADILGRSIEAAKKKIELISSQYDKAKEKLNQLGAELEQTKEEFGENSAEAAKAENAYNRQATAVNKLGTDLNNAATDLNKLEAEMKDVEAAASSAEGDLEDLGDAAGDLGDELDDAGNKASSFSDIFKGSFLGNLASSALQKLGSMVVDLGKSVVSVGSEFEASMSQVAATMGMSVSEIQGGSEAFQLLSDAAREAGATTAFSASEAAQALNYLALAGYDAETAADALPAVLNLAAAGGMDLAYASDLATDAMSALGIAASGANIEDFGDKMAVTASKTNTSVAQLGEAILQVGGTAKVMAGGTAELNAALGILANNGIKGAEGGTHLRNVLLALTAPTDKAAQKLQELGVSATDSSGEMRPLNDILVDLDSSLSGLTDAQKTNVLNTIFNKTDLAAVQALLAGAGSEFDNLTSAIENSSGAMQEMADVQMDNLQGSMKELRSKAEELGISIYDGVSPALKSLVDSFSSFLEFVTPALGTLAKGFGALFSSEYLKAEKEFGEQIEATSEKIESQAEAQEKLVEARKESVVGLQSEMAVTEQYLNELKGITDSNGNVIKGYETRAAYLADYINKQVPGAVSASQSEAGAVYQVSDAIDELVFQKKKEALINAMMPEYEEALKNQITAYQNLNTAIRERNAAQERLNELEAKRAQGGMDPQTYHKINEQIAAETENLNNANAAVEEATALWNGYNQTIENFEATQAISTMDELNAAIARVSEGFVQSTGNNAAALQQAVVDAQANYTKMVMDVAQSWEQMSEADRAGAQSKLEQLRSLLDQQVNEAREAGVEIPTAAGEGINAGAYQFTGATQELYEQAIRELMPGADVNEIGASVDKLMAAGVIGNVGTVTGATANVASAAKSSAQSSVNGQNFQGAGQLLSQNIAAGITGNTNSVVGATKNLASAAKSSAQTSVVAQNFAGVGNILPADFVQGVNQKAADVSKATGDLVSKAKSSANSAVSANNFPSIGQNISTGIKNGVSTTILNDVMRQLVRNAKAAAQAEAGIHSPSTVFRDEVGLQIARGMTAGIESGAKEVAASVKNIIKETLDTADKLNQKLIAKEEALTQALEDTGLDEATKEALTNQLNVVKEFRTEYEKALEDVEKSQESMAQKLKDYGDLFQTVKDEAGSFLELEDLEEQISGIQRYGDALEQLKARGVSDSLMDEIIGLSVDDATAYTQKLLDMTDDQYSEYMALWERKQEEAQKIAETFYADELEALGREFVDKLPEELSDVKDEMRSVGVDGIQGMIDGMYARSGALYSAARSIVSSAIAAMRSAADIHSPSKKTQELIGKPLAQGVEVGFLETMRNVSDSMAATMLAPFEGISRGDLFDAASGVVNGQAALVGAGGYGAQTIIIPVNLNGKQIAEVVYDPLKQVGRQRGD